MGGKRSADAEPEAEADAAVLYAGHYGYAGYPYAYGYPYGLGYYARPVAAASSFQLVSVNGPTHGISQIHKRSADAEPEADAEAAAAYYGYFGRGYGYGYGLGYRGYYGRGYYGYPGYGYGYGRYFG